MKKLFIDNWMIKLVSVVCAVMLWVIVYNSEDPVEYDRFYNVKVIFENTDVLEEEGKVYEVLDNSDVISTVVVQAKRSVIAELSKEDIRVVADFKNLKNYEGTIELDISCEGYTSNEIDFKPSSNLLKLSVEDRVSKNIRISAETIGAPAEDYMINSMNLNQNQLRITGGESIINRISKAVAVVDVTNASDDISTAVNILLYDTDGREVSAEKVEMSIRTVEATAEIYPCKTVPVRYEITGAPAEGFILTGDVAYGTTQIEVAGRPVVLSRVSEILVKGDGVSIEGAIGDATLNIDLDDYLPVGIVRTNRALHNGRTTVTVGVVPIVEQQFTLTAKQITLLNVPDTYFADKTSDAEQFMITVRGAQHLVESIDVAKLKGSIDIGAWLGRNPLLEVGKGTVYELAPEFEFDESLELIAVEKIDIVVGVTEE